MLMGLNFNKIMALGTIILVCSSFVFVSCKGASSRKAATEALEMIEKGLANLARLQKGKLVVWNVL